MPAKKTTEFQEPSINVPRSTLQRLPRYLRIARKFADANKELITCAILSKILRVDATLIRKDLAYSGLKGKPKCGYKTQKVIDALQTFLKWDVARPAILIGAGNMGRALLGYEKFAKHGITIIAAFDNDPACIGKTISGKPIYSVETLAEFIQTHKPEIGIITTPPAIAQEITNILIREGIKGIWNFSPTELVAPDHIVIEDENLSCSLAILCSKL